MPRPAVSMSAYSKSVGEEHKWDKEDEEDEEDEEKMKKKEKRKKKEEEGKEKERECVCSEHKNKTGTIGKLDGVEALVIVLGLLCAFGGVDAVLLMALPHGGVLHRTRRNLNTLLEGLCIRE